jgi:DNA polymerase-3 subunit delta'
VIQWLSKVLEAFLLAGDGTESNMSWPLVGHEWAVELLRSALAAQRLAHALLITGPAQVGKTTLARAVAAALNCQGQDRPCGQCRSCRQVARDVHPDVRLVLPEASKSGRDPVLKIDQIRELQRQAALAPVEGRAKVFLLRDVDRANLPAANALLKTLEEPPAQVVLLLTSTRAHALLPTIVSRCQTIQLRPLPLDQVAQALQTHWGVEPSQSELLARLSGGRIGWAVARLADHEIGEERYRRLSECVELAEEGPVGRMAYAERLSRSPMTVLPVLALWTTWWRDLLLMQLGCAGQISNVDQAALLEDQAVRYTLPQVRDYLVRLQAAPIQINHNVNIRLLLEALLLHMPSPAR